MEFMLQVLVSLCVISFTDPQIICSSEPVEAAVSEDVTLQCHFVTPLDARNMIIEWRHESQNQTVLLNQGGHTSLFPEELTKGNLSMSVSSVQLSDSGRYRCSVTSENLQHSCYVNLTVVPVGNDNQTEVIYNSSHTTDIGLIIGIIVLIIVAASVIVFVNVIVPPLRREITNDEAFGMETGAALLGL